ncbi:DUF6415 family natural product biosynthesis protein [Streptomyces sp. SYP-A7185]|uniref:DUF6415 family natural product biosynthesis protein n=1 Tax=Streptomyces sp. SYP-A7185 TaxID=3040076 RepID=UPI0038F7134C
MNAAMADPQATQRGEKWTPPLSSDRLRRIRDGLVAYTPLNLELIFDDLDAAIGNQPPPPATIAALVERLRGHLKRLCDIAGADPKLGPLFERGHLVRAECLPADHQEAVGLARRQAFLVETLIEACGIKGANDA